MFIQTYNSNYRPRLGGGGKKKKILFYESYIGKVFSIIEDIEIKCIQYIKIDKQMSRTLWCDFIDLPDQTTLHPENFYSHNCKSNI